MRVSKTTAIIALIGTLASATAKADCYQVTVDQAGIPLYRCDQPTQVVQQAPNNGSGEFITGAVVGTVATVLLVNALGDRGGYNRGYYGGRGSYGYGHGYYSSRGHYGR